MSLLNKMTRGLIYKDGETSISSRGGSWSKSPKGKLWISSRLSNLRVFITFFPIWVLSCYKVTWAMKLIGKALGFSSCASCGIPWRYVRGQNIYYSENRGMFPVCIHCFQSLTPEQIDIHIEALVNSWADINRKYGFEGDKEQTPEEVIAAAEAEMRRMKQER